MASEEGWVCIADVAAHQTTLYAALRWDVFPIAD